MTQQFGPHYLWRGLKMLKHKQLLPYVMIPLVINIVLFSLLTWFGMHELGRFNTWLTSFLPSWLQWLDWLFWIIGIVTAILVFMYTFTIVANLIGAPFNGFLSEKIEELLTGNQLNEQNTWAAFAKEIPYMLKQQLRLIGYYLPRAAVILLLFIVPLVQVVAGIVWIIFNMWMLALQYLSYPMENHQLPFKEIRQRMRNRYTLSMSFGGITMLMAIIPIVNLIVMPAAVAGATILWVENNHLQKKS